VTQLRQQELQFRDRNVDVAIITFDADVMATSYVRQTGLRWPLLIDSEHRTYDAYGMGRGSWWSILGPASIWNYLKLILRGRRVHKPGSDYRQLGGDVLIDPNGIVRFYFASDSPHDRPDTAEIFASMDAVENG